MYFGILQEIREGKVSFDTIAELIQCSKKKIDPNDPIQPTKIFPIKKTVETLNQQELDKLNAKKFTYPLKLCHNQTELPNFKSIVQKNVQNDIELLMKNGIFQPSLVLCEGCQVMCICNLDQEQNLVNGSQGVVLDFHYDPERNNYYPRVKFDKVDEPVLIKENSWYSETNKNYSVNQLPIILSWAITTHKSQGLSIEKALIDIGNNIFEYGQTYVALSRVKSLNGLYLTKVNPQKIKAHPKVVAFYKQLKKELNIA